MNYYRRYVGDYLRDTGDLSLTEHGAYNLLIDYCYATERLLPLEYERLYRICFANVPHEQEAVRFVADRFFPVIDGKRRHKRIETELSKALPAIEEMKRAGRKGAARRWGRDRDADGVGHQEPHAVGDREGNRVRDGVAIHPPTSNLQPKKNTVGLKPNHAEAALVLAYLNERAGRAYRALNGNISYIAARLNEGATVDDCKAVIDRKVAEWKGGDMDKYLRPKTLFNATNFANYQGESSTPKIQVDL